MKYMGSKAKYAEELLEAIEKEIHSRIYEYDNYIEPFVGGANMMEKTELYPAFKIKKRIGNDINVHLMEMFQSLQKGWIPPDSVSEQEYKQLMSKSDMQIGCLESPLVGFVGIGCSYAGKWFGGYARGNAKDGKPRNYCLESKKNVLKQIENLKDVLFLSGHYKNMNIINKSIIYCDPPYAMTTKYKSEFEHNKFWDWCNEMAGRGHKVFVSEYQAPEGWRCIWEKVVNSSLTKETGSKKATERLFTK